VPADVAESGVNAPQTGGSPSEADPLRTSADVADTETATVPGSPREEAAEATQGGALPQVAAASAEASKEEYRRIAERRVRLGLLLAEVGRTNNITVTQDEMNQAITREARRHPGYEQQVLDFYRQNPEATANLRAPIFEDKVVDFIVELAKVEERKIGPQELLSMPDPDNGEAASG
jgi:trigger factor